MRLLFEAIALAVGLAACGGWTRGDTLRELGYASVTTMDWAQTRDITAACIETNLLMGKCGEKIQPDVFMPGMILVHAAIAAILPKGTARQAWQYINTGFEAEAAISNWQLGWGPLVPESRQHAK